MEPLSEDALFGVMLLLPYKDLLSWCQSYQLASQLCNDDRFWRQKYLHDFGSPGPIPAPIRSWRQLYEQYIVTHWVYLIYESGELGDIVGPYYSEDQAIAKAADYIIEYIYPADITDDSGDVLYTVSREYQTCWSVIYNATHNGRPKLPESFKHIFPTTAEVYSTYYPYIQQICSMTADEWMKQQNEYSDALAGHLLDGERVVISLRSYEVQRLSCS